MECPRCRSGALRACLRDGIEIDMCAQCRGVWLDRGELEKLLERGVREEAIAEARWLDRARRDEGGRDGDPEGEHVRPHRRYAWFRDLFD
ncbi:MAG: zf-TFIIB domain-containing protein [Planctomycetota bacterium]|nr:zf-TFIIB domain-containing protein [Planctomycetota bacterium]